MSGRIVLPIIIIDGDEAGHYDSLGDAESDYEPQDIEHLKVYDSLGHHLEAKVSRELFDSRILFWKYKAPADVVRIHRPQKSEKRIDELRKGIIEWLVRQKKYERRSLIDKELNFLVKTLGKYDPVTWKLKTN